jgi:tryptophan halogenase
MKNITILGGGSAGWLTALYVRQLFPNTKIILIESSEVGILGAGEGSVPMLPSFLKSLKIDENDFIKKTKATFKLGISFENWNGDNKKYFHPFSSNVEILDYNKITKDLAIAGNLSNNIRSYFLINSITNNKNIDEVIPTSKLAYQNKSPFFKTTNNPNIQNSVSYSYHFDARLTADYLKNIGIERGVSVIDGKLSEVIDNNGDITEIILEGGLRIPCDFIFDCSGFARLLIGKHYQTKWVPYNEQLTVNSAIPFFLPQSEDHVKPYTRAIAMKYGWMWQIPLQHRWGCGYIFNDEYINSEEAKKEVEELLGHEIETNKTFKFNAGRFEKSWVNNCISIGLSSGFTEPLEATSLMVTMSMLSHLNPHTLINRLPNLIKEYNDHFNSNNDEIVSFLHYHYLTDRDDTEFWRDYKSKTKIPRLLNELMSKWENRVPNNQDDKIFAPSTAFSLESWIIVGNGIGRTNKKIYKENNEIFNLDKKLETYNANFRNNLDSISKYSFDHLEYLKSL